ncbi:M-phase inducer phosphatase 3 [Pelodytes ibericus]
MAEPHSIASDMPSKFSSGLHFRTNCRMMLNLLRDKDSSLVFSPEQPLTPVSNLAVGFSNLSTCNSGTPKRCLDLSNLSCDDAALQAWDSPDKMSTGKINLHQNLNSNSSVLQPRLLCSTPSFKKASGGQRNSRNKENKCEQFRNPGKASSLLLLRGATDTQLSPSFAAKGDFSLEEDGLGSPISALHAGVDETPDKVQNLDGFTEFFGADVEEIENPSMAAGNLSSSMAVLLSGPFLNQDVEMSNVSMNRSRLYRSPSMPEKLDRPVLKRPVRPQTNETPVRVKRRRSTNGQHNEEAEENREPRRRGPSLKKTLSLCDVDISKVLDEDCGNRQLIGDFSKVYALPTVTGRHQELRYITAETLAALIHGAFSSLVEKYFIIDCRYPYEFEGGHIQGALNLHREEEVVDYFLKQPMVPSIVQKRIIIVFHCEFSSERGPKMSRFLREEDRALNEYPSLHYPELYVLKGGYKDFFPEYMELCEPQSYCPMHHQDYHEELLKFRTKSKTWAGDRKRKEQIARLMKL